MICCFLYEINENDRRMSDNDSISIFQANIASIEPKNTMRVASEDLNNLTKAF